MLGLRLTVVLSSGQPTLVVTDADHLESRVADWPIYRMISHYLVERWYANISAINIIYKCLLK